MDQIRLTGVRAVGKHGVLDFEHERAQTFVVDATLFLDLAPAGHSDDLHDTVDYGAIAKGYAVSLSTLISTVLVLWVYPSGAVTSSMR